MLHFLNFNTIFVIKSIMENMTTHKPKRSKSKKKLTRRGKEMYFKYFYNSDDKLENIIYKYDNNIEITDKDYDVMFDVPLEFRNKVLELITYYPNKIKKMKIISINDINKMYKIYGECIEIMKKSNSIINVRGKLKSSVTTNAKKRGISVFINSEDIILKKNCPILGIPIIYGRSFSDDNSPSVDRINNQLPYTIDNIHVVSMLANRMKNSANEAQLITFAKYIIKNYIKKF